MFKVLRNAWAIPDLRRKLLFTLFMLFIYRLGSHIPVPGVTSDAMQAFLAGNGSGTLFSMIDAFTGGAFSNATIFAMGITPYINSSIIMNLLTVAIPSLERMAKEGPEGRKKIGTITRYLTVVFGFVQATGLYLALANMQGALSSTGFFAFITITFSFTAGTAFIMWLGEQITDKGVGNGISLIIFAGIVSRIPQMLVTLYNQFLGSKTSLISLVQLVILIVIALAIIAFVVFMNNAERRIPVQYAKRMVGRKMYGGQSSHIPIKVAMAGVIPIIFASSFMMFPSTIAGFFGGAPTEGFWGTILRALTPGHWFYTTFYFLLIIGFTYFYTQIQFNPIEMANNMKKNGGFIPGIRPGRPTSDYISRVSNKITLAGALFLAVIAVIPSLFSSWIPGLVVGGTSLLIVEGVALETVRQIESQMMMRHYKGFLE